MEQNIQGVPTLLCRRCQIVILPSHAIPRLAEGGDMDVSRPRPRTAGMPFTQVEGASMPVGGSWGLQVGSILSFAGTRPHQEILGPAAFHERLGQHGGENCLLLVYVADTKAHIKRDGAEKYRVAVDDTLLFEIRRRVTPMAAIARDGDAYLIHETLPRSHAEEIQRMLETDVVALHPLGADVRLRVHVQSYIGTRRDFAPLFNHLLRISRNRTD